MGFDLLLPVRHRVGSHAGINLAAATTWPLPRMAVAPHSFMRCLCAGTRWNEGAARRQRNSCNCEFRCAGPQGRAWRWLHAQLATLGCVLPGHCQGTPLHALLLARHPGFCRVVLTAAVHGLPVGHPALACAAHLRVVRQRSTVAFQQQEGKWHPAKGACVVALSNQIAVISACALRTRLSCSSRRSPSTTQNSSRTRCTSCRQKTWHCTSSSTTSTFNSEPQSRAYRRSAPNRRVRSRRC